MAGYFCGLEENVRKEGVGLREGIDRIILPALDYVDHIEEMSI